MIIITLKCRHWGSENLASSGLTRNRKQRHWPNDCQRSDRQTIGLSEGSGSPSEKTQQRANMKADFMRRRAPDSRRTRRRLTETLINLAQLRPGDRMSHFMAMFNF